MIVVYVNLVNMHLAIQSLKSLVDSGGSEDSGAVMTGLISMAAQLAFEVHSISNIMIFGFFFATKLAVIADRLPTFNFFS